ncbi:class I mannose-6-phosphate isomerase [Altererythrobacter ishigakiensis]|uniref:Mannose-6-phosphate isomerase n=1 Tax=Altererythrobacter ishigakiensis TaxID=476157 RepID=A0A562USQ7_9SPHN|nr:class I mannose-6-phosphate isomerase [Altererythrobacter ishigakiensis]TWJ08637.1 mannose-6-phosphate isomerase [Altererythrobacter ishigakiensis]
MSEAALLTRKAVAKPWGRTALPPPFDIAQSGTIGEIWFEHAGKPLDLLVKYLFTSEKLSIQVHPSDELAAVKGLPSGKEECWLVLDAEPGAVLGIGTLEPLSSDELRTAALDGSIEHMIDWKPATRGDFYYIPAGTVHAIGAGVTLVEVQQNSDITYRLFDYGRPRELHLDNGVEAASAAPYPDKLGAKIDLTVVQQLVAGPKFDLWLGHGWPSRGLTGELAHLVPLTGSVTADGVTARAGECLICSPCSELRIGHDAQLLIAQARCDNRGANA